MALCAICGKPVICEHVMHGKCWEEKLRRARDSVCVNSCRWPRACKDGYELKNHCDECALDKLVKETGK